MLTLNRSVYRCLAIGLVQGLLLWLASDLGASSLQFALVTFAMVGGINLILLGGSAFQRGTIWLLGVFTLLMTAISAWTFQEGGDFWRSSHWLEGSWTFFSVVITYIVTAFLLSWPTHDGRFTRYEDLFRHAWDTVFIVLLGMLLNAVFWSLLLLWGGLFKMLGIVALNKLFFTDGFIYISSMMVFALGLNMGRENDRVIGLLRGILLTLCRFLLPFSSMIAIVFVGALPFTGLEPIWNTGYSTPIMVCLVAVNLFFLNGVFQDGHSSHGYSVWLVRMVDLCLLCLPLLVVLAGYSTWLRIDQYGLTPSRLLAMLLVLVVFAHSVAAVWAMFAPQSGWLGSLRVSNPLIALACVVLLLAIHTPWFNPLQFSAKNQVQRLLSGKTPVQAFDAEALRYQLGLPGKQAFEALLAQVEHGQVLSEPERAQLLKRLKRAEGRDDTQARNKRMLEWIGPEVAGSEQFDDPAISKEDCLKPGCVLWAVDLDQDGQSEVLLLPKTSWRNTLYFFKRDPAGKWHEAGTFEALDNTPHLIEQIREGNAKVVKPRYQSLDIDGVELSPQVSGSRAQ